MHEKVEARGKELLGREKLEGKKAGRTGRQRVSATANQEDRRGNKCGEHTLEFVLQLEAKTDNWFFVTQNERESEEQKEQGQQSATLFDVWGEVGVVGAVMAVCQ